MHSAGIQLHRDQGGLNAVMIFCRSQCKGFSKTERAIFEVIQLHLSNLYNNLLACSDPVTPNDLEQAKTAELKKLTAREQEIALLICKGDDTQTIAGILGISPLTVYKHIRNIYEKLNVQTRQKLIVHLYDEI